MILFQSKYNQELIQIINEVKKASYSTFVQQYITYPEINLFQLHFTYIFLKYRGCSVEESKSYCISQTFISLGESSHDQVKLAEHEPQDNGLERQLTVLSGDYFSSHYYNYLAEKNQVNLIQKWSEVIKGINEQKTDLHSRAKELSDAEYRRSLYKIKDDLTLAILKWFDAPAYLGEIYTLMVKLYREVKLFNVADRIAQPEFVGIREQLSRLISKCDEELASELMIWLDKLTSAECRDQSLALKL